MRDFRGYPRPNNVEFYSGHVDSFTQNLAKLHLAHQLLLLVAEARILVEICTLKYKQLVAAIYQSIINENFRKSIKRFKTTNAAKSKSIFGMKFCLSRAEF